MNAPDLRSPRRLLRFCGLFLAAIVIFAPAAFAGVNRWTTNGPAAFISSLAIDPTNPNNVYAGNGRAVFRSSDGGRTWITTTFRATFTGFGPGSSGLAIDPLFSSHVYAATNDGVFKTIDAGDSWTPVGLPTGFAYSVAVDPAGSSTVLAGTAGGLFKSSDRGASWGRVLSAQIYNLVVPHGAPSTVFGADSEPQSYYPADSQLYKSTDAGATWSSNTAAGIAINPGALAVDPTDPSTLYAGDRSDGWTRVGGLFKSVDSGSTWRQVSSLRSGGMSALVVNPRNPRVLYAATQRAFPGDGVFRSTDGGVSWVEFNAGLTGPVLVLAIDRTGTRLYAGTPDGVFGYQIYSGVLDVAAGADNTARLLFVAPDGRVVFRSFDNAGTSTAGGSHGPYSGWSAIALADGSDGLTRVLWSHGDGSAALWLMGPSGNLASYLYSPPGGWTAVDVSVAPDSTTHILWTHRDGRTRISSVDFSGTVIRTAIFGPYTGWLARSISDGPDGLTRLLWSNSGGRIGLSWIEGTGIVATSRFAGLPGWEAQDIAVANDNQTRVLWANAAGQMFLWSVEYSGAVRNLGTVSGPPVPGRTAARISAGADGLTRVLWTGPEGSGTVWLFNLEDVFQGSFAVGATP